jgi:hypothetical protein
MKSANLLAIALVTALVGCKAADAPAGDAASVTATTHATVASPTAAPAASTPAATEQTPAGDGRSLCAAGESVVFSCTLVGDKKFASLCASKGVSDQAGYLYFAQGAAGRADYVYPADKSAPGGRFKRSHLGFGGGSGGFAYSFEDAGRKHIVYSISGEGLEDQGVIVAAATDLAKADSALACDKGSVIEDEDDALFKYTMSWPKDEGIEKNGLPPKN